MAWGENDLPRKSAKSTLAMVDYTLAKRALLRGVQRGLLGRTDICDAHPELLRAARHVGESATRPCPVCDNEDLRLLAYVFADDLKTDNGRVHKLQDGLVLTASHDGAACYVVEVCLECSWNHLSEAFQARFAV
jgi:hypothetical protein